MKALKLISVILLSLTHIMTFHACAADKDGHTLTKLWSEYQKAVDADRPKDQADILTRIKEQALSQRLAWDYYDACWKYVDARVSTNWKLRDELRTQADAEIGRFDEPVMHFYNWKDRQSTEDMFKYVQENKDRLLAASHPEFHRNDPAVNGYLFSPVLVPSFANDYEFALWSLLADRRSTEVRDAVRAHFKGRYPQEAFAEYTIAQTLSTDDAKKTMDGIILDYPGKAVTMLARQYLLIRRNNDLRWDKGSSEQYSLLADDCARFINDRKLFSGEEKAIADCCTEADEILATLTAQTLNVEAEKGTATFSVRNIPSVRVRILDGAREVFSATVDNPKKSFYVPDTLTLRFPDLEDKTYNLVCTGGKVETKSEYQRYTLSIAHKRDHDGYGVYVADYLSGEPVKSCRFVLYDNDGKEVARTEAMALDGFTYLPESITGILEKGKHSRYYTLQAVTELGGRIRKSPKHGFGYQERGEVERQNPPRHRAMLITDRSAFNPDETVRYKVMLYEGTYEFATRAAGIRLRARLTDPEGKEIGEEELTTGEYGSAAGAFVLRKGAKGGMYTITIFENGRTVASTRVRADEFVLPTFDLSWKPDDRFYLPGDEISAAGTVRSYSGHSINGTDARWTAEYNGEPLADGKLELSPAGDFSLHFKGPEARYYYSNVVITVRVTDATGETLEFRKTVGVSANLPLNIAVTNRVDGRFEVPDRYSRGAIVGEDVIRSSIQLGSRGAVRTHPALKLTYKLLHEGKVLRSGEAENGKDLPLDLSGYPSGLYTIEATASAKAGNGNTYDDTETFEVVKASDADTVLDMDVASFFKEIADDGRGIALQFGSTTGPVWAVAELYGDGNRLLEHRIVRLAGVRGKEGSLATVRFDRRPGYPEALSLKLFWFKDAHAYEYTRTLDRREARFQLPLSFSRFLDTTAPHTDYSFTLRTAEGVEVAATIFDKSTETIQPNRWHTDTPDLRDLPYVGYDYSIGVDESYAYRSEEDARAVRTRGRMLSKSAAMGAGAVEMMVEESAPMAMARMEDNAVSYDAAELDEEAAENGSAEPENEAIRENFANTIAWEPFLRSDKDGVVTFNFSTADKLSTYYVQIFAHDKAFHNETLRKEMVVTLPVKVAVVQPQFLYEGDRYVARVSLANSTDKPVSGRLSVKFLNGKDYRTAPTVSEKGTAITVPAHGSADFSFGISAPRLADLGLLVNFTADDKDAGSDGVFVTMPVKPAVQTITEAHSALLLAGMDRDALLASLRREFVNVQGAQAALKEISILGMIQEAVPEKVLPQSDNLLDQSEALFANHLIDILPGGKASGATPEQRAEMVEKILACRNGDGGFGWFPEMSSSAVLTAVLLERIAEMGDACPEKLAATAADAVRFLDATYFGDRFRPIWCGALSFDQYLHVRALFPEVSFSPKGASFKELREFKKNAKAYLVPGAKRGLNGQVFAKARRMKTLRALVENERGASLARAWGISLFASGRLRKSLEKDVESLLQYAEPHRSGGIYYPNAVMPWRGLLESELYAHSLICDLLTDCGHNEVAEGIRLWIMVQKETQQWEDDPAYIQAIGSVLRGTEATLQTKVLALSATTTLPFEQIKAAGNGFTVSRSYTREGQPLKDGDVLHVGDKVVATYRIWNEENRSFVRLTAPRPAAFRPVNQLSGRYGWFARPISITGWVSFSPQGYRSVLADRTEFWFDSYPEENTSFTEEFFVTQEGTFQSPVPVIESLYAPHYRANDDGKPAVTVQP